MTPCTPNGRVLPAAAQQQGQQQRQLRCMPPATPLLGGAVHPRPARPDQTQALLLPPLLVLAPLRRCRLAAGQGAEGGSCRRCRRRCCRRCSHCCWPLNWRGTVPRWCLCW